MPTPTKTPYGSWRSPISTDLIIARQVSLSAPRIHGDTRLWLESRPSEGGRSVVVSRDRSGRIHDLSGPAVNVRSRVHEYGGGAWTFDQRGLWFVDDRDQRIYRQSLDGSTAPLTPVGNHRYADLELDPSRERLLAVRESHAEDNDEPSNTLVSLAFDGSDGSGHVLAEGEDFYASARFAPDGRRLSWLSWNHPDMPWDQNRLNLAELDENGDITTRLRIVDNPEESVFQPQWSQGGQLYFASDRTGWWNMYHWNDGQSRPLLPMEAEFGLPQWVFGMSTWAVTSDERLVCAYTRDGSWGLGVLAPDSGAWRPLDLPYTEYSDLQASGDRVVFRAASATQAPSLVELDLLSGTTTVLAHSMDTPLDRGYLSRPKSIEYLSSRGETAHALYYPPCNRDFEAPPGERPPLLVRSHGGPTAAASTALNLGIQFWTSRGFALLDVNYGGSTGYGRRYRKRLDQRWGQTDVDDCVHGAQHLIDQGLADPRRCAIRGSSAGGYTTLASLTFHDLFSAGASLYGISDLETLAEDTHKFESRYLDRLIGPYPASRELYAERSPIHFTERLNCPVLFLQGLQDKVVPPSQAQAMVDALKKNGLPVAYLTFADEQHGFRQAATIKTALDAELYFYGRVFGFTPADPLPAINIDNLDRASH